MFYYIKLVTGVLDNVPTWWNFLLTTLYIYKINLQHILIALILVLEWLNNKESGVHKGLKNYQRKTERKTVKCITN